MRIGVGFVKGFLLQTAGGVVPGVGLLLLTCTVSLLVPIVLSGLAECIPESLKFHSVGRLVGPHLDGKDFVCLGAVSFWHGDGCCF